MKKLCRRCLFITRTVSVQSQLQKKKQNYPKELKMDVNILFYARRVESLKKIVIINEMKNKKKKSFV